MTRGLTLIEVLVSIVLLSLITITCVPMLRHIAAMLEQESSPETDAVELSLLADAILDSPQDFGIVSLEEITSTHISVSQDVESEYHTSMTVSVERIEHPVEADHTWLLFSGEHATVMRWIALPDLTESTQP